MTTSGSSRKAMNQHTTTYLLTLSINQTHSSKYYDKFASSLATTISQRTKENLQGFQQLKTTSQEDKHQFGWRCNAVVLWCWKYGAMNGSQQVCLELELELVASGLCFACVCYELDLGSVNGKMFKDYLYIFILNFLKLKNLTRHRSRFQVVLGLAFNRA